MWWIGLDLFQNEKMCSQKSIVPTDPISKYRVICCHVTNHVTIKWQELSWGMHIISWIVSHSGDVLRYGESQKMISRFFVLQLYALSNEYYTLMPSSDYTRMRIPPITTTRQVRDQTNMLVALLDIELASKILLGAQLRIKGKWFAVDWLQITDFYIFLFVADS